MKKILLIVLVLLILGVVAYSILNKLNPAQNQEQQTAKTVKAQVSDVVISPINSYNNQAIWYGTSSGRIMRLDLGTGKVTEHPLPPVQGNSFVKIFWPSQGNDFISLGNLGNEPVYNYYNFEQQTYNQLPSNILNLDWLHDGRRVVMVWKTADQKIQLVTSNADASGYKVVTELPWADLVPKASPTDNTALLVRPFPKESTNKIYLFNLETGEYSALVESGKNNAVLWSPDGKKFAYTQMAENGSQLFLHDMQTSQSLPLQVTANIENINFSLDGNSLFVIAQGESGDELRKYSVNNDSYNVVYKFSTGQVKAISPLVIGEKVYFLGQTDKYLYKLE